nr:4-alpha-glucanotransferase [Butyrivibrio sp. FCS014]
MQRRSISTASFSISFRPSGQPLSPMPTRKGIRIVGDIPIYVAFDSADTWANPQLFLLDKEEHPH